MKLFDKITKRFTKSASTAVKSEVKKTFLDVLPKLLGAAAMVIGVIVFKEVIEEPEEETPVISNTNITTNNYFFRDVNDEMIKKILKGDDE